MARCRDDLIKQIRSVEKDPGKVDTPISMAIDMKTLRQSENPLEKSSADIIMMLQDIRTRIEELGETRRTRIDPRMIEEFLMYYDKLSSVLELPEDKKPTRMQFEEAQMLLRRIERTMHMFLMESGMPPRMIEDFMNKLMMRRKLE